MQPDGITLLMSSKSILSMPIRAPTRMLPNLLHALHIHHRRGIQPPPQCRRPGIHPSPQPIRATQRFRTPQTHPWVQPHPILPEVLHTQIPTLLSARLQPRHPNKRILLLIPLYPTVLYRLLPDILKQLHLQLSPRLILPMKLPQHPPQHIRTPLILPLNHLPHHLLLFSSH